MKNLFITLVLLAAIICTSNGNIVNWACKHTPPQYKLCVSILNSFSQSKTASTEGLALLIVDVLKQQLTEAVKNISGLIQSKPLLKATLIDCAKEYKADLEYEIKQAIDGITFGMPKFAVDVTKSCSIGAASWEAKFNSSISNAELNNKYIHDISDIGTAIITILL